METVTLHTRMRFILLPKEGIRNSNGKGVQEEAISKGVGSDSQGLFFQGLWNKNYCFYWWSYINSYSSECFFHSLPVWYSLLVYECHQLMNYAGHPAHCFIFHDIIVVFTVLWSCPISLLLTCFWVKGIIVYWFFHRCSHSTLDKTVLDWCYIIQK